MKYVIITGRQYEFAETINQHLARGYELYGEPYWCDGTREHAQAMILRPPQQKESES
jgi:hypothetical protein